MRIQESTGEACANKKQLPVNEQVIPVGPRKPKKAKQKSASKRRFTNIQVQAFKYRHHGSLTPQLASPRLSKHKKPSGSSPSI